MNVVLPTRMTVDEFLDWAACQERGRYELFDGRVVMQQPERWGHLAAKGQVFVALRDAVKRAGVPFYVAADGATVRVDATTAFEPDALVAPLPYPHDDAMEIPDPVLVVEVLSPATAKRDLSDKVTGYFKVSAIQHYLVIDPADREVLWYRRAPDGTPQAPRRIVDGSVKLDPPGIDLAVREIFPSP